MNPGFVFKKCLDILEDSSICRRCILRFFGAKEYKSYVSKQDVENTIQRFTNELSKEDSESLMKGTCCDEPEPKRLTPSPCAACLGILQEPCDNMILKVVDAVAKSEHIFKNFVMQFSLPAVVELRNKLFHCLLKEKLGDAYSLEEDGIPTVKDICKWVVGSEYEKLAKVDFTPDSSFQIMISSTYPDTVKECFVLFEKVPSAFLNSTTRRKTVEDIYSKASILKAMTVLSSELKSLYSLPPPPPSKVCTFAVQCHQSPLYLGGRYNKYSRELSQTPWLVDGEKKMESSVNELIASVVEKHVVCDEIVFSASGREDVDVRMLGNGRPFVLEVLNPRRLEWSKKEMENIRLEINSSTSEIGVPVLQVITKDDTSLLKEGEEMKRKTYSALCITEKVLDDDDVKILESTTDLKILQKTPMRVLHRRTLSTREKTVHSMKAKIRSDHELELTVETQAGTYVKEFVHSDFGRTTPNIGSLLGTNADILELDVQSIDLDWPPKDVT